ncbi:hypothetical protein [Celeribacter sp. ULVN23_4]
MPGWGEHYDEFWTGIGSSMPSQVLVAVRNTPAQIFFHGPLGLVVAEKIESFEFDGWEIFDGIECSETRFENVRDAKTAVLKLYLSRVEEIRERGDDPDGGY